MLNYYPGRLKIESNENIQVFIFVIILVILLTYNYYPKQEKYSQGALEQLLAKDTQDVYLTGRARNYDYNPHYDGPFAYNPYWFSL